MLVLGEPVGPAVVKTRGGTEVSWRQIWLGEGTDDIDKRRERH